MKLPYRLGDSFALPLGNGQFARSFIVACEHRVVVVRILAGEESWLDLRVSDDALVLHRWKRDGRVDLRTVAEPRPQNPYWMHAARAERIAAAALGAPHPRERKIRVIELNDANVATALAGLDDDCVLTLTAGVSPETLGRVSAGIADHPGVALRLDGDAAKHLDVLSETPLTRLSLAGPVDRLRPLETLRFLDLAHGYELASVAAAFPNIESLRIAERGLSLHLGDLALLHNLRTLDLSLVDVGNGSGLVNLPKLTELRLSRVNGLRSIDVGELPLRKLAVEHTQELRSLDEVAQVASLEQLALLGLWQFDIAHLSWTLERERLVRAEIDIGGRRKNIELYRRANWAYPWRWGSRPGY